MCRHQYYPIVALTHLDTIISVYITTTLQVGLHWDMLALVRSIYVKLVFGGDVTDIQVYIHIHIYIPYKSYTALSIHNI
jgi:hypothetical protein